MTLQPADLTYDSIIQLAGMAQDKVIAVDTESGESRGLMGISLAFKLPFDIFSCYLPIRHDNSNLSQQQIDGLYDVFTSSTLVFHNAMYDLIVLEHNGYRHHGIFYDTMLMSHWINENLENYSLDWQSKHFGGNPKNRPEVMQFIIDTEGWDAVPKVLMDIYSSNDALITFELFEKLLPEFKKQGFDEEIWHIWECEFIWAMGHMVDLGIRIDPEFCMMEILRGEKVMIDCYRHLGFSPGKRSGLKTLLLEQLGLPILKKSEKTGEPSFDRNVMEQYDIMLEKNEDPRAKVILRYRGWQKTVSANYKPYLDLAKKDENGYWILHPGFKLHGTVTSRLSCERPALHQIPRESEKEWNGHLKRAFIARDGFGLWEFDYGQLEFRLAAAYSEEPILVKVFHDPSRNLFRELDSDLHWGYDNVKTFSYATMYGSGVQHTSEIFGVSRPEAKQLIDEFYGTYPRLRRVQLQISNLCKSRGYIKLWSGRRRHFMYPRRDAHKGFNAVLQGGGAEIVKRSIVRLARSVCDDDCRMVLTVHDSVLFEIRTGREEYYHPKIKATMEDVNYQEFGVPFRVEMKEWK